MLVHFDTKEKKLLSIYLIFINLYNKQKINKFMICPEAELHPVFCNMTSNNEKYSAGSWSKYGSPP